MEPGHIHARLLVRGCQPVLCLVDPLRRRLSKMEDIVLEAGSDGHAELELDDKRLISTGWIAPIALVVFPEGRHVQDPVDRLERPEIRLDEPKGSALGGNSLSDLEGDGGGKSLGFYQPTQLLAPFEGGVNIRVLFCLELLGQRHYQRELLGNKRHS